MTRKPSIHKEVFIAPGARLVGEVTVHKGASIWYNAVLRGDIEPITIFENANVQDNCVIHTSKGQPAIIGKNVTLGHCAVVHGAVIEENALIGMNAVVLNGALVGAGSV
ncbi:MAG: gamma carbonic anhydrase family protein, partial [Candidatus Thermoplasmatota archaeon]|nr:gamma carbonic anhydrase family protein [Candidatus Thermoplasmatota archaeon]